MDCSFLKNFTWEVRVHCLKENLPEYDSGNDFSECFDKA